MYSRMIFAALLLCLLALHGCGGSGKGISKTTPIKLSITWGERSRAINAPSSTLSAVVTLANASATGSDFVYSINRDPAPQTYTGSYTSANSAKVGAAPLTIRFYAQADGAGAVVGIAQAKVTIKADGTGIGSITTTNTIASVSVPVGQTVRVGQTKDLAFTAQDAQGSMVAVTPGSATFTLAGGGDKLQIVGNQAKGVTVGTASVSVMVDGKSSVGTDVTVTPLTPTSYVIADLGTLDGDVGAYATSINSQGTVVGVSIAPGGTPRAVMWKNGAIHLLGISALVASRPVQINDREQVIGSLGDRAFQWQNGSTTDIDVFGGNEIHATAINNNGVIVGYARNTVSSPGYKGFSWQQGDATDLGGDFIAYAINDSGVIAGSRKNPNAFGYTAALLQNGVVTDIGPPSSNNGNTALTINAAGHAAGSYQFNDGPGFFWKEGVSVYLDKVLYRPAIFTRTFTYPLAMNDLDQVVGVQSTEHGGLPTIRNAFFSAKAISSGLKPSCRPTRVGSSRPPTAPTTTALSSGKESMKALSARS